MASSDSQIDKPQRGRPERAELPDANINTGVQSINTERASLSFDKFSTTWDSIFLIPPNSKKNFFFLLRIQRPERSIQETALWKTTNAGK